MRKIPYVNNEYYHIYNRGVEKRKIFLNKSDYERFLFILGAFNGQESGQQNIKKQISKDSKKSQDPILRNYAELVEIEEYCLMPNHFHLMLRQIEDGGISKFLQKVGIGYTMYFNTKYERDGVLFQGRHKSKHVNSDPYFYWLKSYISLNPLDLYIKDWKEKGIPKSQIKNSINFLNNYKWVSCNDHKFYREDLTGWESRPEWQEE